MTDIARAIATDFIDGQGWACIHVQPGQAATTVTIGDITARDAPGARLWLKRREADRTIEALFSRCQQARRRSKAGLMVDLAPDAVNAMVRTIAESLGYVVTDDDVIDGQLELVHKRIGAALSRMKPQELKALRREHRLAPEPRPTFDQWLAERLRPAVRAGLGLG